MKTNTDKAPARPFVQKLESIAKLGMEKCLCDLPENEFQAGGLVTELLKEVGCIESGNAMISQRNWWNLTVKQFRQNILQEYTQLAINSFEPMRRERAGLLAALDKINTIAKAGVIHRNETDKPQWSAFDEIKNIVAAATKTPLPVA